MYKIALCDDDMHFTANLEKKLRIFFKKYGISYELSQFSSISSLEKSLKENNTYDLLFLDIYLGKDNGMQFAKQLRQNGNPLKIIFITISLEYAAESYDVSPIYYLVKPLQDAKLHTALERALFIGNHPLAIHSFQQTLILDSEKLLYLEVYNHSILVHKADGTYDTLRGSLNQIERTLPPLQFLRPQRSYLVNIAHIVSVCRYEITLSDHIRLPVSRNRFSEIQLKILDYLSKKSSLFI